MLICESSSLSEMMHFDKISYRKECFQRRLADKSSGSADTGHVCHSMTDLHTLCFINSPVIEKKDEKK